MDRATLNSLAERYLDMMRTRDLSIADEIFSDDFRCWFDAAGPAPLDREGYKQMVAGWLQAFPDLTPLRSRIIVDHVTATVAVQMSWRATHAAEFMGAPPTGRVLEGEGVSTFRAAGDRFVEEWVFEDIARLTRQLAEAG